MYPLPNGRGSVFHQIRAATIRERTYQTVPLKHEVKIYSILWINTELNPHQAEGSAT